MAVAVGSLLPPLPSSPARRNRFSARKQPRSLMQRFLILLLIGGIAFLTLIIVMMKLGRASADNDPNLDPMFNPHIRVGQE